MTILDRSATTAPRSDVPSEATPRRTVPLALMLLASDAACAAAVIALTAGVRVGSAVFTVALLALFGGGELYRRRLSLSLLDDLPVIAAASFAAVGTTTLLGTALPAVAVTPDLMAHMCIVVLWIVAARAAVYTAVRRARRAGHLAERALIVGCGGLGAQLVQILTTREHGLDVIGFVDDDPRLSGPDRPLPVLGRLGELRDLVLTRRVDAVVVGYSNVPEGLLIDILRTCDRLDVEIYAVPRLWQMHSSNRRAEVLRGVPLVRFRRPAYRSPSWPLKRAMDIAVAGLGLLLAAPIMLACAVAVRLEGGPGVIFRQVRVGLDGRSFTVLKFRSVTHLDAHASATQWGLGGDDRIGPVGRWIRRLSIDELPQLWNVLRGDMSMVGPRPERPHFVAEFSEIYEEYPWRQRVPCGLSGWAQVHGLRGDTSISDRARYDNHYIENWSLWLDVKILLRTVQQVLMLTGQ